MNEVLDFLLALFGSSLDLRDWIAQSRPELKDATAATQSDSSSV